MRFYVPPQYIFPEKNIIEIKDKKELHHIRDVMRLKEATDVTLFDGQGTQYEGCIKKIDRNSALIEIKKTTNFKDKDFLNISLYQAVPKKNKMDFIVEKAVELGVNSIIPIITDRTIPIIKKQGSRKTERWRRIATQASKQCGRVRLPFLSDTLSFGDAVAESKKADLVIFAALDKEARPLRNILNPSVPKNIAVFVGPEGDFSEGEVSLAKKEGLCVCSLGRLVLRVETAALYILSCLNYEYK